MRNLLWLGNSFYKIPRKHMLHCEFNMSNLEYLLSIDKRPDNAIFHICNLKCIHKCNTCMGLDEYGFNLNDYEEEFIELDVNDFLDKKN